jgi:hypothetical protein
MKLPPALLLAAAVLGAAEPPRITRSTFVAVEKAFDNRLQRPIENPFNLLGGTRGLYLDGFGAVFTAELNLVSGPTISPFRPEITEREISALKQRKIERLSYLKQIMREAMQSFAASLDTLPASEQIVLGVSLFYYKWEDSKGLPSQVLMQASREALLAAGSKADIKVQEY